MDSMLTICGPGSDRQGGSHAAHQHERSLRQRRRHHPLVSAGLIVTAVCLGLIAAGTADPAAKLWGLRLHVLAGGTALLLTLVRVGWWLWADTRPAPPAGQPAAQRWAARIVHALLYLAVLVLGASGIGTIGLSGAAGALLAGTQLPDFGGLVPRLVHGAMGQLLLVLLALHVAAALYHQFIRRDRLLARMGIG
ncbi:MAG TPA: cytochrome B [Alphaproteobacteria bacterium]|nr:cytochrome B [Alphaproteobacteria bacterium]